MKPIKIENNFTSIRSSPKRTLRVPSFLHQVDEEREIYPKGIIAALRELSPFKPFKKIPRVEWFADQKAKIEENGKDGPIRKKFGIVREFFPAYSSEPKLIQLARSSSNVIEVHANGNKAKLHQAGYDNVFNDKLILKGSESPVQTNSTIQFASFGERVSELLVPSHWLDVTRLCSGDRVLISNPREDYEMPPPLASSLN